MNEETRKAFESEKSKFIFSIEHENDCKYKNRKNTAVSDCLCYCYEMAIFKAGIEHQQKKIEELEKKADEYFNLWGLAMDFIHLSPCDPDIDDDQLQAWLKLQKALKEQGK